MCVLILLVFLWFLFEVFQYLLISSSNQNFVFFHVETWMAVTFWQMEKTVWGCWSTIVCVCGFIVINHFIHYYKMANQYTDFNMKCTYIILWCVKKLKIQFNFSCKSLILAVNLRRFHSVLYFCFLVNDNLKLIHVCVIL